MTTTTNTPEIPGYGERFGDVHPRAWIMHPDARRCLNCDRFVSPALLAGHRDECPLPVADGPDDLPIPARGFALYAMAFADGACEFCGTTEDVALSEDPFSADVYDDHTPVLICGSCMSDRADEI